MDEQVPASQEFQIPQAPQAQIPKPDFAAMRQMAMQQAIAQHQQSKQLEYQMQQQAPEPLVQEPKVVYVRRNFTVAELLVTFLIACAVVLGGQFTWNFFTDVLPRIEIREK